MGEEYVSVQNEPHMAGQVFVAERKSGNPGCLKQGLLAIIVAVFSVLSFIGLFAITLVVVLIAGIAELCKTDLKSPDFGLKSSSFNRVVEEAPESGNKQIAVINVHGVISNSAGFEGADAGQIVRLLQEAMDDDNIVAVVLDMDTPGGEVVASDEINRQVRACSKSGKPVVTCMRSMGASGGYFIAAASDWIIANRMTFTGSIGVIMSTMQYSQLLDRIGVGIEVYASGKMKDMMNGARPRTEQERQYVQELIDSTFHEFCQVVANGRQAYKTADDVKNSSFGDGRVLSGSAALECGLIDDLGYYNDALEKARELGHAPKAGVIRLSPKGRLRDLLFAKFGQAPEVRIKGLPAAEAMPSGRMYYLAPELLGAGN